MRRKRLRVAPTLLAVAIALAAVFAPLVAPYPPNETSADLFAMPSTEHWLGTDSLWLLQLP